MKFYIFFIVTLIPISSVIGLNDLRSLIQSLPRTNERESHELLEKVNTEEHSKENTKNNKDPIHPEDINLVDNEKNIETEKYDGEELLNNKLDPELNNDDDGVEKPGMALIQPDLDMLESAAKFPKSSVNNVVYGNLNSLGITYGNTRERLLNTNFRKQSNSLLAKLLKDLKVVKKKNKREEPALVFIKTYDDNDSEDNLPLRLTYNTRRIRTNKGTLRQFKITSGESEAKEEIVEESEGIDEETEENDEQVLSDKIDSDNENSNENEVNENDNNSEEGDDKTGESKKLNLGVEKDETNNDSIDESEKQKQNKSIILDLLIGKGKKSQEISEANKNSEEIVASENTESKIEQEIVENDSKTNTDKENTEENEERGEVTKTSDYIAQISEKNSKEIKEEESESSPKNVLSREEILESEEKSEETKISEGIVLSEETDGGSKKEEEIIENSSNPVSGKENIEENVGDSEESDKSKDIMSEENDTESKKKQKLTKTSDKLEGSGAVYGNLDNLGIT